MEKRDGHEEATVVVCPRCGKEFECSRSADCWCSQLEIPEDVARYLAEHYESCVCRACLEELTAS
ncbi:hypothetical protein CR163_005080 [Prosthecochloris sp. ZM_2]|uniref:cysteine-rich CWC family protein n=1 Tax=Prosthecochloris sp. ZM_2 TaxID=2045206 RepID=UPI000DF8247C|nr:cysteine-rich CWC family protein [Prosthecochloris sp. ZM_2]RNA64667.1 hypothetical protein CR163_005080 [Prosthecochloris sp. ZM_2]